MSGGVTFTDLIVPGELGDTRLELRLTAREFAAVQWVLFIATRTDDVLTEAFQGMEQEGISDRWAVAFQTAQARAGLMLSRVLGASEALDFAALLAQADQEQSAIDHEEETS